MKTTILNFYQSIQRGDFVLESRAVGVPSKNFSLQRPSHSHESYEKISYLLTDSIMGAS